MSSFLYLIEPVTRHIFVVGYRYSWISLGRRSRSSWTTKIVPTGMKFAGALLFAGVMARCILSQEPPVPSSNTATEARAQDQKSGQEAKSEVSVQDTTSTFKIRVNLVQVHVVVRDGAGKPVGRLRKEDFQLYGNLRTVSGNAAFRPGARHT